MPPSDDDALALTVSSGPSVGSAVEVVVVVVVVVEVVVVEEVVVVVRRLEQSYDVEVSHAMEGQLVWHSNWSL